MSKYLSAFCLGLFFIGAIASGFADETKAKLEGKTVCEYQSLFFRKFYLSDTSRMSHVEALVRKAKIPSQLFDAFLTKVSKETEDHLRLGDGSKEPSKICVHHKYDTFPDVERDDEFRQYLGMRMHEEFDSHLVFVQNYQDEIYTKIDKADLNARLLVMNDLWFFINLDFRYCFPRWRFSKWIAVMYGQSGRYKAEFEAGEPGADLGLHFLEGELYLVLKTLRESPRPI